MRECTSCNEENGRVYRIMGKESRGGREKGHNAVKQGVGLPSFTSRVAQMGIVKVALRSGHNARVSKNTQLRSQTVS